MQAVDLLTIREKKTLYKDGVPAERIELITFEENDFTVVSQKDLYKVGDKVIYIYPDFNLPDISLFEDFIRPGGDLKKSKLGGKNRIRAIKFNFFLEGQSSPVYSNGIALPYEEVLAFMRKNNLIGEDYTSALGIFKYEEPEKQPGFPVGQGGGKFPEGIYKTDETNFLKVSRSIQYPITFEGRVKNDGSSITFGVIDMIPFVGSRQIVKRFKERKFSHNRKKSFWEKLLFWTNPDLRVFTEVDSEDTFVQHAKPYIDALINANYNNVLLRGEIVGETMKGSGNKNNPDAKKPIHIKVFGVDNVINNHAQRVVNFTEAIDKLNEDLFPVQPYVTITPSELVFRKTFNSSEEIIDECENYFKHNLVEGIVIRDVNSLFSAKVMNNEYDAKK